MNKILSFLVLLSFFYNSFCWYDWTVWVPEPVKNTISTEKYLNGDKIHSNNFFGPVDLENQYFKSSISINGPCNLKNVSVDGDVKVHGPLTIDGSYTKKQKEFTQTAKNVVVYGPANISNAVVNEKISVKGPIKCINVQCKEKIKVTGKCTFDNVTAKTLQISLKKKKKIKLHDVTIDTLIVKSKKPIKVYVSGNSTIKEVQFTKTIGEVITEPKKQEGGDK